MRYLLWERLYFRVMGIWPRSVARRHREMMERERREHLLELRRVG